MSDYAEQYPEQVGYETESLEKLAADWHERIRASEDRERQWRQSAEDAENIYSAGNVSEGLSGARSQFNILHANIETVVPSLYNSTPKPDIRARHNADDPAARAMADILERAISYSIDDGAYDREALKQVQDAETSGRGVMRVRFDFDERGAERITFEAVSWRDFRCGPAKRWSDVPWVAFLEALSPADVRKIGDEELLAQQGYQDDADEKPLEVWNIWDKETRSIYVITRDETKVLGIIPDPFGLRDFFPCAEPLQPISIVGKITPVCPYDVFRFQIDELDKITARIDRVVEAMKARGICFGFSEDFEDLGAVEDGVLVTASQFEGGMIQDPSKAIAWWPTEKFAVVLQSLYAARDQVKQTIYEITGISDIVRGATQASETATAQNIKSRWGSLRIRRRQLAVQSAARDAFVIAAEIISRLFSHETIQRIGGSAVTEDVLPFLQQAMDHYRIDVETDSTIRADLTGAREEMNMFLAGTAQFMGTLAPIVQQAPETAVPMLEIYGAFARQFSLGREAEASLEKMIEVAKASAGQPRPNPEAERAAAEKEDRDRRFQLDFAQAQFNAQLAAQKAGIEMGKLTLDERKAEIGALATASEIDLEEDQQRPVAIG